MGKLIIATLMCLVGAKAHAQFDQIFKGQNVDPQTHSTAVPSPGPHSAFCGLGVGIQGPSGVGKKSLVLTYGVKHNVNLGQISNGAAYTYCKNNGLYNNATLKANLMAEAEIFYPDVCDKTLYAFACGTSGAAGNKPFGWSYGGDVIFTWKSRPCKPSPTPSCVDSGKGNIQITSTSITNYPGLTATSPYYGKVTVNYKNIGGTFCKAPQFSFYYKGIFTNAIANGGPASTLTTTLANQTGTTTWQFGREQTGIDCKTTRGPKNAQIEIGINPTTSSHLTLPVTVNCP